MIESGSKLDRFSLIGREQRFTTRIGEVELGPAAFDGGMQEGTEDPPTANVRLDTVLLANQPVDYFGAVSMAAARGPSFVGNVTLATPEDDGLRLCCQTHPSLTENLVGRFESFNCDAREIAHVMSRTAGLAEGQIEVEGFDDLPLEVIESLLPLSGVEVDGAVRLGRLTIVDPRMVDEVVNRFESNVLIGEFESADSVALFREPSRSLLGVEANALRAVDTVLGWFTARSRYGLAMLPDGQAQQFKRTRALSQVSRGQVVLSRGLESGRSWLRELVVQMPKDVIALSDGSQWTPPDPDELSTPIQLALAALRRATLLEDSLQRIQALWESIEFYAAGVSVPRRFSKSAARRVRRSIPADIDGELRDRALDLLAKINDPPLMAKLREAVLRDEVPMTENEFLLLQRVRTVRNRTAHGRPSEEPSSEDVDYAISVVARLIMHGMESRSKRVS